MRTSGGMMVWILHKNIHNILTEAYEGAIVGNI